MVLELGGSQSIVPVLKGIRGKVHSLVELYVLCGAPERSEDA